MGLFDGWPFKSREQSERDAREFHERVFPLGMEQREAARAVLRAVVSPKLRDPEMLFAFISAKDKYVREEQSPEALDEARAKLKKQRFIKPHDIELILALVRLDTLADSLEAYPTAEDVQRLAQQAEAQ